MKIFTVVTMYCLSLISYHWKYNGIQNIGKLKSKILNFALQFDFKKFRLYPRSKLGQKKLMSSQSLTIDFFRSYYHFTIKVPTTRCYYYQRAYKILNQPSCTYLVGPTQNKVSCSKPWLIYLWMKMKRLFLWNSKMNF